jgi:hypothetical protein
VFQKIIKGVNKQLEGVLKHQKANIVKHNKGNA